MIDRIVINRLARMECLHEFLFGHVLWPSHRLPFQPAFKIEPVAYQSARLCLHSVRADSVGCRAAIPISHTLALYLIWATGAL
jgi:hypothetical protein